MRPSAWRFSSVQNAVLFLIIGFVDHLVSIEIVQVCSGVLTLTCPSDTVIKVHTVSHGVSCFFSCCNDIVCSSPMSSGVKEKVEETCNGQQNCMTDFVSESMSCSIKYKLNYRFKQITYSCRNITSTTDITPGDSSNSKEDNNIDNIDNHEKNEESSGSNDNKENWLILVLAAVCVVVLIFIITLVAVIIIKRKQFPPLKVATQTPGTDNGNETISLNQIQRTKQNQDGASSSAVDGNKTLSTVRNKPQNSQNMLCEPENGVYSLAQERGSLPNSIYSTVEKKEPEYLVPNENRTNIYSLVESTLHTGASKNTPGDGGDIYCNVDSTNPAKMTSQTTLGIHSGACQWQDEPYEEVCLSVPAQKANLKTNKNYPLAQTGSNIKDGKANTGRDTTKQKNTSPSVNDSDLSYELMSSAQEEGIYANDPASGHRHQLESVGSDSTTTYCNMQSPKVKLNNDGAQIVVENDLYSH